MAFIFGEMTLSFAKCFRKIEIDEKPFTFNHFHSQFIKDVITFARCHTEMFKKWFDIYALPYENGKK
ncbi:MAG: hypothetical protein GXZ03_09165 [Proteiniphilum sp.]|nr:hypothetical protein [Proteiniphilum sp.]